MIPAPALKLSAVAPLLVVAVGACVVLAVELVLRARRSVGRPVTGQFVGSALALLTAAFLAAALAVACNVFVEGGAAAFNPAQPLVRADALASFASAALSLAGILGSLLSVQYLHKLEIHHGEYYALLLVSLAGMMLMVSAVDLLALFLGLEIMSIPLYVLAGFDGRKLRSNEAALKSFLSGGFASAVVLYGMALLYGATGATHYDALAAGLEQGGLGRAGVALVAAGLAFKIAVVPFHQWVPDVMEGAPTPVAGFFSVAAKLAAFVAFLRLFAVALAQVGEPLLEVLRALAALTLLVGAIMAAVQDNLKRLLAYAGVSHAGLLLVAFVAGSAEAFGAVLFFLAVALFMNLGAFAVVVALAARGQDADRVDDLAGLARSHPRARCRDGDLHVLDRGGPRDGRLHRQVPAPAGRCARRGAGPGARGPPLVAALVVLAGALRVPVVMYMREPSQPVTRLRVRSNEVLVLGVCAIAVVALGIFPNAAPAGPLDWLHLLDWSAEAAAVLPDGR